MKNILHLITSLKYGGTENYLYQIVQFLKNKFNFFIGYLKEKGYIAEKIEREGLPVVYFNNIFEIIKFIKNKNIQILHTHLYRANIIGRIAGKITNIPVISSQLALDNWRKFYHVWFDYLTTKFCKLVIVNSYFTKKQFVEKEKIPQEKIVVVYNGIDFNSFKPKYKKEKNLNEFNLDINYKIVGTITRLHKEKGVDFIPYIVKNVSKNVENVKFLIVGDGPEEKNFRLQLKKNNLSEKVYLIGFKDNIPDILTTLDVFFLPSREESFPQVILEAMTVGVPVVANDIGGINEIVEDGKTGFLVNNLDMMVKKIIKLLTDAELHKKMIENSREKVKNFDIKKMISQIENIYNSILRG